jgi:hypothetical protein
MLLHSEQHSSTSVRSPRTPSIGSRVVGVRVFVGGGESCGHELRVAATSRGRRVERWRWRAGAGGAASVRSKEVWIVSRTGTPVVLL